jgi:hypothetical protein
MWLSGWRVCGEEGGEILLWGYQWWHDHVWRELLMATVKGWRWKWQFLLGGWEGLGLMLVWVSCWWFGWVCWMVICEERLMEGDWMILQCWVSLIWRKICRWCFGLGFLGSLSSVLPGEWKAGGGCCYRLNLAEACVWDGEGRWRPRVNGRGVGVKRQWWCFIVEVFLFGRQGRCRGQWWGR